MMTGAFTVLHPSSIIYIIIHVNVEEAVQGKIASKMRSPGTMKPKDQGYRESFSWMNLRW